MSRFRPKETLQQAQAAEKSGDARKASNDYAMLSVYFRKKQRFPEAKKMIDRAIHILPTAARLYVQSALCEWSLENDAGAKRAMRTFTESCFQKGKVQSYTPFVEDHLKDYPQLRQIFYETLLKYDRTTAEPFIGLGRALLHQRKVDQARVALLDALETGKKQESIVRVLREILEEEDNLDGVMSLEKYLAGDMSREDLVLLLGGKKKKQKEKPIELESPSINEAPEDAKTLNELISELETELELDSDHTYGDVEPLVKEFRRRSNSALKENSKTRLDMGCAFYEMGRYKDAKEELSEIQPEDPNFLQAQCMVGLVLFEEGSDLAALDVFQKVLRDARAEESVRKEGEYQMARIYYRLCDYSQAKSHLESLEKMDPDYRAIKILRKQIEIRSSAKSKPVRSPKS